MGKYNYILLVIFWLGILSAQETPAIDSVWFSEEIICNDSNIVSICYILSGDTADIIVQISSDGGENWIIAGNNRFDAFSDYMGHIGYDVPPDTHCFQWIMNEDMPGAEGYDWIITVQARKILFADSFSTLDTTLYQINGNDGFVNPDSEYFVLTQNTTWRNGRLMTVDTFFCDTLDIEFMFKFIPGWCDVAEESTGADGLSLIFSPLINPPLAPGGSIGIIGTEGWGIEFDTYNNWCGHSHSDIDGNHTAVSIDSVACLFVGTDEVPISLRQTTITFDMVDNNWHYVNVEVRNPHCKVTLDGITYIDEDFSYIPSPFWAHIGISASTGDCYTEHIIDNLLITDPTAVDTLNSSDTAIAPLDAHNPQINIHCPEHYSTSPDDTITLNWSIDDLFWRGEPGTLCVEYEETSYCFEVIDTSFDIVIPATCESISINLAIRDSFCNWGYDTCSFRICSPFFGLIECAPCEMFTSCSTQTIAFLITDTVCYSTVESVYFTVEIHDSAGGVEIMNISGPSENVQLEFIGDTTRAILQDIIFANKDSVLVIMNSVLDDNGCRMTPIELSR